MRRAATAETSSIQPTGDRGACLASVDQRRAQVPSRETWRSLPSTGPIRPGIRRRSVTTSLRAVTPAMCWTSPSGSKQWARRNSGRTGTRGRHW